VRFSHVCRRTFSTAPSRPESCARARKGADADRHLRLAGSAAVERSRLLAERFLLLFVRIDRGFHHRSNASADYAARDEAADTDSTQATRETAGPTGSPSQSARSTEAAATGTDASAATTRTSAGSASASATTGTTTRAAATRASASAATTEAASASSTATATSKTTRSRWDGKLRADVSTTADPPGLITGHLLRDRQDLSGLQLDAALRTDHHASPSAGVDHDLISRLQGHRAIDRPEAFAGVHAHATLRLEH
jgi:hypothetical protein